MEKHVQKFKYTVLLILLLILGCSEDDQLKVEWQKSYGGNKNDDSKCIQRTNDNGFILAGETYSNDGDVPRNYGSKDGYIVKLDEDGSKIWANSFGGSNNDVFNSIYQTSDDGYIVGGYTHSTNGSTGTNGKGDCWVIKLNRDGHKEWEKRFGGVKLDIVNSINETVDGGYIVAGLTYSDDGKTPAFYAQKKRC